jgi:hypothetical protein
MSNEMNVNPWGWGVLAPGTEVTLFWDFSPRDYAKTLNRVRVFNAAPFVQTPPPGEGLDVPPDPPYPTYEQRVAITEVFYLLKATPTPPPGEVPPNSPALQVNVTFRNLSATAPVSFQITVAETDN